MAIVTQLEKRAMMEMFKQKASPTLFLSSWFRTSPNWIYKSRKIVMDIKRNNEAYAVDVTRFGGGNFNANKRFSTKEYVPPYFNEYTAYTAEELFERLPGQNEYQAEQQNYMAQLLALLTDDQILLADKILRAREIMSASTLLTGTVTLVNQDTIDYKQKNTHNFSAGTAWSGASKTQIRDDLIKACDLNRKDGKVTTAVQNAIMSATSFSEFIKAFETDSNYNPNVKLIDIGFPIQNTQGASFHGRVSAGAYILNVWTYPQYYSVFDNSGVETLTPYITDERVIVIPDPNMIDLRTVYAGIPDIARGRSNQIADALGLPGVPTTVAAEMLPYYKLDEGDEQLKAGVKSSFLTIPAQIDGWSVIQS